MITPLLSLQPLWLVQLRAPVLAKLGFKKVGQRGDLWVTDESGKEVLWARKSQGCYVIQLAEETARFSSYDMASSIRTPLCFSAQPSISFQHLQLCKSPLSPSHVKRWTRLDYGCGGNFSRLHVRPTE